MIPAKSHSSTSSEPSWKLSCIKGTPGVIPIATKQTRQRASEVYLYGISEIYFLSIWYSLGKETFPLLSGCIAIQ